MSDIFKKTTDGLRRVSKKLVGPTNREIEKSANYIKQALIAVSPVDKGVFQKGWVVRRNTTRGGSFTSFSIYNRTEYSDVIEYGSPVGSRPWPSAGAKTVQVAGRIYSSQAVGGIFRNVNLEGYATKLTQNIHAGIRVTL